MSTCVHKSTSEAGAETRQCDLCTGGHARADRDLRADHGLRIGGGAAVLRQAPPEGRAAGREAVGPLAEGRRQAVCQAAESHEVRVAWQPMESCVVWYDLEA